MNKFSYSKQKGLQALLLGLLLMMTSCSDFLDIKPYGKAIPKTTEEYQALVMEMLSGIDGNSVGGYGANELFMNNSSAINFEDYCDNVESSLAQSSNLTYYISSMLGTSTAYSYYEHLYKVIGRCNIILDNYEDGRDSEKGQQLIATCYALRGLAYYQLLRMYCEPAGTSQDQLGMPLVTDFDMEAKPNRSSYEATFKQIENDFKTALDKNIKDKAYMFTPIVVKGLLARLYFWTGHFKEAKQYAD